MSKEWTTFYAPLNAFVMAPRYDSERQPYWKKCFTQLIGWRFEYDENGFRSLYFLTIKGQEVIADSDVEHDVPTSQDFGRNYYFMYLENGKAPEL